MDDHPRPGREPSITLEAKAWLTSLSRRKAKEVGYPHELWTTRLLARHAREHGPAEGHPCPANLAQGTLCKILDSEEVKRHKVRYYLALWSGLDLLIECEISKRTQDNRKRNKTRLDAKLSTTRSPKRELKRRRNMSLKWLKGATMVLAFWLSASAQASVSPGPVTLQAHDGVSISGLVYEARQPRGIILLFHQAGSSKAEYATIAPRLAAAGFTALAIDQRSGGTLYGPNETVSRLGRAATYDEAKADLEAALDWALPRNLPIILWGSSYSAALVFEVGAEHMNQVNAILAFSPGEYLNTSGAVARAAGRVQVPIYVTSSSDADEIQAGREILSAAPARVKAQFVPKFGVHGSSTLNETRNPKGAAENWNHVLAFLSALSKPPG